MSRLRAPLFFLPLASLLGILALPLHASASENLPYVRNDAAGHYQNVGGTTIYYEVYGADGAKKQKPPLVLLHDGLEGSIADFAPHLPKLTPHFTVYAVATRGHGRSGVGDMAYTYQLFADAAAAILRRVTVDVAAVIGFGDGALAALALTGEHPHLVSRVVAIGAGRSADGLTDAGKTFVENLSAANFARDHPGFLAQRRPFLAEPDRWAESVDKLAALYRQRIFVSNVSIEAIVAPTLLIGGDHDERFRVAAFEELHRLIPPSRLAILPNSTRLESLHRESAWSELILPFLLEDEGSR